MVCAAENETMTDDEIHDEAGIVADALLTLLEGRPSVVAADACLRALAELIATEHEDDASPDHALRCCTRALGHYVEAYQARHAGQH